MLRLRTPAIGYRPMSDVTWRVVPGSVDGHPLLIDELKGTKPTEKIDLSGNGLGVASAIIIASWIKENGVLKELKCAAAPRVFALVCQRPLTRLLSASLCHFPSATSLSRSLQFNHLKHEAKRAVEDAAGGGVRVIF